MKLAARTQRQLQLGLTDQCIFINRALRPLLLVSEYNRAQSWFIDVCIRKLDNPDAASRSRSIKFYLALVPRNYYLSSFIYCRCLPARQENRRRNNVSVLPDNFLPLWISPLWRYLCLPGLAGRDERHQTWVSQGDIRSSTFCVFRI